MNIISTVLKSLNSTIRKVTVTTLGKGLTRTPTEAAPFGSDTNPVASMQAVYMDTVNSSTPVLVGYFNLDAIAQPGENRQYATDADGNRVFYTWMKNDGTFEIGGNANHMTQFEGLQTAFNQLRTDHDAMVAQWNSFCTDYIPGGPTVAGLPLVGIPATLSSHNLPLTNSTADITPAKLSNIKTE